jgi:hypothetical protein
MTAAITDDFSKEGPAPASPDNIPDAIRFFVRQPSPMIVMTWAAVAVAVRLYLGSFTAWDLAVAGALLAWWPFKEWLIHVHVLHFKPRKIGRWTFDPMNARKHRRHHRNPWRIDILFIPEHTFLYGIPVLALFWIGVMPTLPLAFTGLMLEGLLTLHYEWVHFIVHTRYKPKSWLYQRLWRNHRLHHCKNEHYWLGVTMLAGDKLLGTAKEKDAVETSETCMTLGAVEDLGQHAAQMGG